MIRIEKLLNEKCEIQVCKMCPFYGMIFQTDEVDPMDCNDCFQMKGREDPNKALAIECMEKSHFAMLESGGENRAKIVDQIQNKLNEIKELLELKDGSGNDGMERTKDQRSQESDE